MSAKQKLDAESCRTCRYYLQANVPECHRHSPIAVTHQGSMGPYLIAKFPPTRSDDWCGDFELKITVE